MINKSKYPEKLWLGDYTLAKHQLTMNYGLDDMRFSCTYWYSQQIDLYQLLQRYSKEFIEKLIFNIICFQANKLCSLKPKYFDLGPYKKYWTPQLQKLWREVFYRVWGQWRYQNDFPDYRGPEIIHQETFIGQKIPSVQINPGKIKNLCFFGGGKDSLASTTILDNLGEDYEILTYTNSIYGSATKQIQIIKGLIDQAVTKKYSYLYVYDDFVTCPILQIGGYDIEQILAAETPSGIFSSLIFCLSKGYTSLILGHEKSADKGNLIWNGEDINHQWGKSTEAEQLLREYIQKQLISNVTYYSILKSLYDTGIILVVSTRQTQVHLTHSCNLQKPWCKKCSKCCYVWLLYMATFNVDIINKMFEGINLLDQPENQIHFRQLLGLQQHTPFQCVGGIEQVKICFEVLRIKGIKGLAMSDFQKLPKQNYVQLFDKFSKVDQNYQGIPAQIRQKYFSTIKQIIHKQKQPFLNILNKSQFQ